jgi:hypothetical protein
MEIDILNNYHLLLGKNSFVLRYSEIDFPDLSAFDIEFTTDSDIEMLKSHFDRFISNIEERRKQRAQT